MDAKDIAARVAARKAKAAAEEKALTVTVVAAKDFTIPVEVTDIVITAEEVRRVYYRAGVGIRTTLGTIGRNCHHDHRTAVAAKECARKMVKDEFGVAMPVTPKEVTV